MSEYGIPAQYRGPPGTGNGGYVAGRAALLLGDGPGEATLRRPVPLDTPLRVTREPGRVAMLDDAGTLVIEARSLEALELEVPPPPLSCSTLLPAPPSIASPADSVFTVATKVSSLLAAVKVSAFSVRL